MVEAPPLAYFLALWGLELVGAPRGERPKRPGTGEVAFVRRRGVELVLKTIPDGTDEARSGEVLAHWDGQGAVRLIEQAHGAVLIERARPGEDLVPLAVRGDDEAATAILCEVLETLDRPAPACASFRTVEDWGGGFARNRERALAAGIDAALVDRGAAIFADLRASQAEPILLHGDLQHYNVLRDAARGWLAIDPKGVLGEPAYETGALLRNPISHPEVCTDPKAMDRRVSQICERLGYQRERVVGWCFSQWMLAVLWALEDGMPFAPDWLRGPAAALQLM